MKRQIRVKVIPLYKSTANRLCFECGDSTCEKVLDLLTLDGQLDKLARYFEIVQIDILGGDVCLVSDFYFDILYRLLKLYCKKIITNTSFINFTTSMINNCDILNVHYNFNGYSPISNSVFSNIRAASASDRVINLKSLDISCKVDQTNIIDTINGLGVKSWEIIPYYPGEYSTKHFHNYTEFEDIVNIFLKLSNKMEFAFQNKLQIENILKINNYDIDTIYITPNNNYALPVFNKDRVILNEIDKIDDVLTTLNTMNNERNEYCKDCDEKIHCLANYYFNPDYIGSSCSGFKNLLISHKSKGKM